MAENMDSQLKQMSEDLKEIIEQLNEENKAHKMSNPVSIIHLNLLILKYNFVYLLDNTNWKNIECTYELIAVDR